MSNQPAEPDDYEDKSAEFRADPDREQVRLSKPPESLRVIILFILGALVILGILAFIASRIL